MTENKKSWSNDEKIDKALNHLLDATKEGEDDAVIGGCFTDLVKTLQERENHQSTIEQELHQLKTSIHFYLGLEVYETLVKVADSSCNVASVLGGKPCGKCPVCLIKPLEKKLRTASIRESWRNPQNDLDTYWRALYAVRCIAEHTGNRTNARNLRAKMENVREIADGALQEVPREY